MLLGSSHNIFPKKHRFECKCPSHEKIREAIRISKTLFISMKILKVGKSQQTGKITTQKYSKLITCRYICHTTPTTRDWNSGRRRRSAVTGATSADLCCLRLDPPTPHITDWLVASKQDEMTLPHAAGGMRASRRRGSAAPLPPLRRPQQLRNSGTCENPLQTRSSASAVSRQHGLSDIECLLPWSDFRWPKS